MTETSNVVTDDSMNHVRQLDLFDPRKHGDKFTIFVAGVGGVGSFLVPMLAKMGWKNIVAYDFDKVEEHNQPNQNFSTKDIGAYKVDAVKSRVYEETGTIIKAKSRKFDFELIAQTEGKKIVVLAVDSIDTRKQIYDDLLRYNTKGDIVLVLDSRIGALMYEVFMHDPRDSQQVEVFKNTMNFDSKSRVELPCTGRAIIYIGHLVAAEECVMIRNWAMGVYNDVDAQYILPELVEYGRHTGWKR